MIVTKTARKSRSAGRAVRAVAAAFATAVAVLIPLSCSSGVTDNVRIASIYVEPEAVVVAVGALAPLTAVLKDAGGSTVSVPVAWSSSDTSIATVSNAGVVMARKVGDVRIAATAQGMSATAEVGVSPKSVSSVRIEPNEASVRVGGTTKLDAFALDAAGEPLAGRSITWSSSNPSIASVSIDGTVTGRTPGAVTITATSENRSGSAAVTVTLLPIGSVSISPAQHSLLQGESLQLSHTIRDENGNVITGRSVSWSSNASQVASVTSTGVVTALAPGTATITASSEGKSGTAVIVVTARPVNSVTVTPQSNSVQVGATVTLAATLRDNQGSVLAGRVIAWTSSNTSIAVVNNNGVVTGVAPGSVTITATSEGKAGSAGVQVVSVPVTSVTVTPGNPTILTGRTIALTATARSSSGAVLSGRETRWSSGATNIATVSSTGVVTGISAGTVLIFAEVDGVVGSTTVRVDQPPVASVTVTPASPTVALGGSRQMSAVVRDADGNVLDRAVSWTSSDDTTVFITSSGVVIGFRKGSATITATVDGVSGSTLVTVN